MLHEAVVLVAAVSTGVSGKDIQLSFQFIYLNTPLPPPPYCEGLAFALFLPTPFVIDYILLLFGQFGL